AVMVVNATEHVWGIGLTRTGTSSLNRALSLLGYSSVHWPTTRQLLDDHLQAATDESVAAIFKVLDFKYPGSKFILTMRDEDDWVRSTEAHRRGTLPEFKTLESSQCLSAGILHVLHRADADPDLRERAVEVALTQMTLYGTVEFDERKFRDGFRRYHAEV